MRSIRQLLTAVLGAARIRRPAFRRRSGRRARRRRVQQPGRWRHRRCACRGGVRHLQQHPARAGLAGQGQRCRRADWADGKVEIVDNVATQKLREGAPAGKYTVPWRVVSSDSHPIEGTFTFTATAGAEGSTAAAPVPTVGTQQPGVTPAPENAPDASEPFPWSLVVFAAVAVGLLVALGILARRKLVTGERRRGPLIPGYTAAGGRSQSDRSLLTRRRFRPGRGAPRSFLSGRTGRCRGSPWPRLPGPPPWPAAVPPWAWG